MHERISKDSIYNRYLAARNPSAQDLERLCSFEGETGVALVSTVNELGEKAVAMACYGIDTDCPTIAEPAILVEDGYQGRGLGKRMMWGLYDEAVRNGLEEFVCFTQSTNQRVLCLIEGCGLPYESRNIDGLIEIRIRLKPGLPASPVMTEHHAQASLKR
jgi:GNAT superfamily N-acetyltransferase